MKLKCNSSEEQKSQAFIVKIDYDLSEIIRLVDKAAGGDFDAFGELYGIYLDRIYRYVRYQVKDTMTAEDITEDVFVKAWKAIRSCKGKGRTFSAWIYRIAHNHMINTLRSMKKCVSIETDDLAELSESESAMDDILDGQELSELLTHLPPNQKQVVILKFIEGMGNREIGKIMNKSEGAIRLLQMRALTTLRQIIGGGRC